MGYVLKMTKEPLIDGNGGEGYNEAEEASDFPHSSDPMTKLKKLLEPNEMDEVKALLLTILQDNRAIELCHILGGEMTNDSSLDSSDSHDKSNDVAHPNQMKNADSTHSSARRRIPRSRSTESSNNRRSMSPGIRNRSRYMSTSPHGSRNRSNWRSKSREKQVTSNNGSHAGGKDVKSDLTKKADADTKYPIQVGGGGGRSKRRREPRSGGATATARTTPRRANSNDNILYRMKSQQEVLEATLGEEEQKRSEKRGHSRNRRRGGVQQRRSQSLHRRSTSSRGERTRTATKSRAANAFYDEDSQQLLLPGRLSSSERTDVETKTLGEKDKAWFNTMAPIGKQQPQTYVPPPLTKMHRRSNSMDQLLHPPRMPRRVASATPNSTFESSTSNRIAQQRGWPNNTTTTPPGEWPAFGTDQSSSDEPSCVQFHPSGAKEVKLSRVGTRKLDGVLDDIRNGAVATSTTTSAATAKTKLEAAIDMQGLLPLDQEQQAALEKLDHDQVSPVRDGIGAAGSVVAGLGVGVADVANGVTNTVAMGNAMLGNFLKLAVSKAPRQRSVDAKRKQRRNHHSSDSESDSSDESDSDSDSSESSYTGVETFYN